MKINFGAYNYFDPNISNTFNIDYSRSVPRTDYDRQNYNTFAFNKAKFDKLIMEGDFNKVYQEGIKYQFADPKVNAQHLSMLESMRIQGQRDMAIFNNIANENEKFAFRFARAVNGIGGTDVLDDNNPYKSDFNRYKQSLGGDNSTKLQIKFKSKKRTLFDSGWLDWLIRDDKEDAIETFYKQSGLNEEVLKKNGIVPALDKDGNTVLTFSKSHALSNQIILGLTDLNSLAYDTDTNSKIGSDPNSKVGITSIGTLGQNKFYNKIEINGIDDNNNISKTQYNRQSGVEESIFRVAFGTFGIIDPALRGKPNIMGDEYVLSQMAGLYKSAKDVENKYDQYKYSPITTTSVIAGNLSDHHEYLNMLLKSGQIDKDEYRKSLTDEEKQMISYVKSMGVGQQKIYSNGANESGTDMILKELDTNSEAQALYMIAAANVNDMRLQTMISNGVVGTLITIDPASMTESQRKNLDIDSTLEDMQTTRKFQFFIPGLFHEQGQQKIANNTKALATQELSQMQQYNYDYTTKSGVKISPNDNGTFKIGNTDWEYTSDEAVAEINKDMIITNANIQLLNQYTNSKGEIFNEDEYEEQVKRIAYSAANEIYPQVNITSYDKFFDLIADGYTTLKPGVEENINLEERHKMMTVLDIYNQLMNNMRKYKLGN